MIEQITLQNHCFDKSQPMKVCPECDTPQTNDEPFCENCGYRLRSAETQLEGLPAISPEMLMASKLRRPERVETEDALEPVESPEERATAEEPAVPPGFERPVRQTEQETPAITQAMLEQHREQQRSVTTVEKAISAPASAGDEISDIEEEGVPPAVSREPARRGHVSTSTVMEGMQAVKAPADRSRESSATSPSGVPAVERSGVYEFSPPLEQVKPSIFKKFGGVFAAAIVGALFGAAGGFLAAPKNAAGAHDDASWPEPAEAKKIAIPAGTFKQGLDDEKRSLMIQTCYKVDDEPDTNCDEKKFLVGEHPQKDAETGAYEIDATEVSVAQYDACVAAGSCEAPDYKACKVYTNQGLQIALRVPKMLKREDAPVVCVTHAQAAAYCEHAGGQLPTHAQWERAARGDEDGRLFPWGDTWSSTNANWGELDVIKGSIIGKVDGYAWTSPAGAFKDGGSPYKLHDMAGNVSEWTREVGKNAKGKDRGFARGGSWTSDPFGLRVTGRIEIPLDKGRTDVGIRCVYEK